MFEKVNPAHPDKIADEIAGALVDYAYTQEENPRIAVEVLIGHGDCTIIAESSVKIPYSVAQEIACRIAGKPVFTRLKVVPQDSNLARNQDGKIRCGDNGVFCGMPVTEEQKILKAVSEYLYWKYASDGKYIFDESENCLIICQSNAKADDIMYDADFISQFPFPSKVNPLGDWTGGTDVDTGATNRKLGSDMGDAVTGGGLHGKDLSKADVSVNIYAHLKAQRTGRPVELYCAIGDEYIDGKPYSEIVEIAREYIGRKGGFEKFAEWGLV